MNNPLPAALASIKRYTIEAHDVFGTPRAEALERDWGEYVRYSDIAQLFAILPPPADGNARVDYWTYLNACKKVDLAIRELGRLERYQGGFSDAESIMNTLEEAKKYLPKPDDAAPPADSAMVEARRDAERYRWLRDNRFGQLLMQLGFTYSQIEHWSNDQNKEKLDDAIDAAKPTKGAGDE